MGKKSLLPVVTHADAHDIRLGFVIDQIPSYYSSFVINAHIQGSRVPAVPSSMLKGSHLDKVGLRSNATGLTVAHGFVAICVARLN